MGTPHGTTHTTWLPPPAVQNQFDSLDLSDNAIVKLEGFPKLGRLKQLLLNNNHVARIARKLEGGWVVGPLCVLQCGCRCATWLIGM